MPLCIGFYYEGKDLSKNRIVFEILNKILFDDYLVQLKSLNFKLIETKSDVNETVETYKNATVTIEAKIIPVENYYGKQKTFYKFYIVDNKFKQTKYNF